MSEFVADRYHFLMATRRGSGREIACWLLGFGSRRSVDLNIHIYPPHVLVTVEAERMLSQVGAVTAAAAAFYVAKTRRRSNKRMYVHTSLRVIADFSPRAQNCVRSGQSARDRWLLGS